MWYSVHGGKNQALFHKMEAIRSVWGMYLSTRETLKPSTNVGIGNKTEHKKTSKATENIPCNPRPPHAISFQKSNLH